MRTTFVTCLILLSACASRYEQDKSNPHYQNGDYFPAGRGTFQESGGDAAFGLVASAISLAANRDYYKGTAITGKCLCRGGTIEVPCGAVDVAITDRAGKELSRTQTDAAGDFAFTVQKGSAYRLKVLSKKFKVASLLDKDFFLGDDVLLRLVKN